MAIIWAGPITKTITADNLGDPEVVTPQMFCSRVTIQEAGAVGTTEWIVRAPFYNSDPLTIGIGGQWAVQGKFVPGGSPFAILRLCLEQFNLRWCLND